MRLMKLPENQRIASMGLIPYLDDGNMQLSAWVCFAWTMSWRAHCSNLWWLHRDRPFLIKRS